MTTLAADDSPAALSPGRPYRVANDTLKPVRPSQPLQVGTAIGIATEHSHELSVSIGEIQIGTNEIGTHHNMLWQEELTVYPLRVCRKISRSFKDLARLVGLEQ